MDQGVFDQPIDIDVLFRNRPELFPHSIPTLEKRRTVFVGELVKIVVGIRESEGLVSGCWLKVESISTSESDLRVLGRAWKPYYSEDFSYSFGPEHIYRMEPRRFYLWGSNGIPNALRSGDGPEDQIPARPFDQHEQVLVSCEDVILEFTAPGNRAADEHYRLLASRNAGWPSFDDLK